MIQQAVIDSKETERTAQEQPLPRYAAEMADFHRAFEKELRELIYRLPMPATARVLDVGSGDGFYTRLLAERVDSTGCVVGLDVNPAFLQLARRRTQSRDRIAFVKGKLRNFPAEEKFDVVWCAQSLYSLPEPATAIQDMARLTKPGGLVAILESDTLHQLLLPWPPEVELAVRVAEHCALVQETPHAEKYYVGRRLRELFAEAGLEPAGHHTQCIDRQAPLDLPLERFLTAHLHRLAERVAPHVNPLMATEFQALISPRSERFLLRQPQLAVGWINVLAWAHKPRASGENNQAAG